MERWSSLAIIKEHLSRFLPSEGLEVADLAAEPSPPPFFVDWTWTCFILTFQKKSQKKCFRKKIWWLFCLKEGKIKSDILARTCCWGSHTGHPHFEPMVIAWMIRETQFLFGSYKLHVSYYSWHGVVCGHSEDRKKTQQHLTRGCSNLIVSENLGC